MNRILRYCFLLLVAELLYFTLKFLERKTEYIAEVPSRKYTARHQITSLCQSLFSGKEIHLEHSKKKELNEKLALKELLKDCPRMRFQNGYDDKPVSEEELKFPLAFSIKMHTGPHQVERLLRTIYRPHNFYCIHVDSDANAETYSVIKGIADCLKNVVVLTKRFNIVYGSIRLVMAELACMKRCVDSNVKWKYYINLTGQEFVLRTNLELVKILSIFNGANDVESYSFTQMDRIESYYILVNDKIVKLKSGRKGFKNVTLHKGSAYCMFTRDFVDFVLTDDVALDLYHWLNTTWSPDETIWPTLNRLPFAPGGYPGFDIKHDERTHASKAVIWSYEKEKCYGKFVHDICVFNSGDLPWLRSRPEIAANKFHESFDYVVLDCLEEWVNHRAYSESLEELNWYYYRNLPQVNYYQKLTDSQKSAEFLQDQKKNWLKTFHYREYKQVE